MSNNIEAKRRAQTNYTKRMSERGYQRATVWMPEFLLDSVKNKASKEGITLQEFIVRSIEQSMQK